VPKKPADEVAEFAADVVAMVKEGGFDPFLEKFDEAVTERIAQFNDEQAKQQAKSEKSATKTVPQPTRKGGSASKPSFVPDVNGTYVVADGVRSIGGKKVKFLRFRKDDTTKAVVEMLEDAAGAPKGKKMVVVVASLKKPSASAGRRVVKKGKK
jgi:hypothetical protein